MYGIVLPAEGKPYAKKFSDFGSLQKQVGGYVELVHPQDMFPPFVMLVNEDGKLLRLEENALASNIYGFLLVGDVVIMKEANDDIVGLSDEEIALFMSQFENI